MEVDQKRSAFINEMVDLCRKHRVLLEVDDDDLQDGFAFVEQSTATGYQFIVDIASLESILRLTLWNELVLQKAG
jgi:hypothetical protein